MQESMEVMGAWQNEGLGEVAMGRWLLCEKAQTCMQPHTGIKQHLSKRSFDLSLKLACKYCKIVVAHPRAWARKRYGLDFP